jgi:hypothetical protein
MLRIFLSNCLKSTTTKNLIFKFPLKEVYEILFWDFFCFFIKFFRLFNIVEQHFSENSWDSAYVLNYWLEISQSYRVFLPEGFFNCLLVFLFLFSRNWFASREIKCGYFLLRDFFFDFRLCQTSSAAFRRNPFVCPSNRRSRACLLFLRLLEAINTEFKSAIFHQPTHACSICF